MPMRNIFDFKISISTLISLLALVAGTGFYYANLSGETRANAEAIRELKATSVKRDVHEAELETIRQKLNTIEDLVKAANRKLDKWE